ncbi:hypothetical protein OA408_03445 [Acidimicrobiaceae bacterium]|nr:hypothetical protein [Acidimicrobiaceae bacterium]
MQKDLQPKEVVLDQNGNILAIILDTNLTNSKKEFHTKSDQNFQVGTFNLDSGDSLERHVHLENIRTVNNTSEVLIIQKGELNVEIFDHLKNFVVKKILKKGTLILFIEGGHSFKADKSCKFIEIKQGPYSEGLDKEKF